MWLIYKIFQYSCIGGQENNSYMKKNIYKKINLYTHIILIFSFIFPLISFAQSVSIESDTNVHNIGDTFLVTVLFNSSGKSINSFGGKVVVPPDYFEVQEIQTGDSFISLWTQKPSLDLKSGEILFSGGLPGGYSGSAGTLFTFVVRVTREGDTQIQIEDFVAFLNDGRGTPVTSLQKIPLESSSKNDPSSPNKIYTTKKDTVSPESFILSIDQDPSIENGKYFVSFFATDKDSGIQGYQVEEYPWGISIFGFKQIWKAAQNPQVLKYQKWGSTIKVKVFDTKGNFAEEKITKPMAREYTIILWTLLALLFIFYIKKNNKRV